MTVELNNKVLENVNGGFHFGDRYEDDEYAAYGVIHISNWFTKDEYILPGDVKTDYDGVVKYMRMFVTESDVHAEDNMWNSGFGNLIR